jgi:hypothetical protein
LLIKPTSHITGLFGVVDGGVISNLDLENVNIQGLSGYDIYGMLCGGNIGGILRNCSVRGNMNCGDNSEAIGGICGTNEGNGEILECSMDGNVIVGNSSDYVGGICGNNEGVLQNSYVGGQISVLGGTYHGGLCGRLNGGRVENSYISVRVTGTNAVGTLCGNNNNGTIKNCIWNSDISNPGTLSPIGSSSGTVVESNIISLTDQEMKSKINYTQLGWDFVDTDGNRAIWMIREGNCFPWLEWQELAPADFAGSHSIDLNDFSIFSKTWQQTSSDPDYIGICDLNNSAASTGVIDFEDLIIFLEYWLQ